MSEIINIVVDTLKPYSNEIAISIGCFIIWVLLVKWTVPQPPAGTYERIAKIPMQTPPQQMNNGDQTTEEFHKSIESNPNESYDDTMRRTVTYHASRLWKEQIPNVKIIQHTMAPAISSSLLDLMLMDVAWADKAIKSKGLESIRKEVESAIDTHFDESSVNKDMIDTINESCPMDQTYFIKTFHDWMYNETEIFLKRYNVEKTVYNAVSPRRSARKQRKVITY